MQRTLAAVLVAALTIAACSSQHPTTSASTKATFCAAARGVKAENAHARVGGSQSSRVEQIKQFTSQFNRVKLAASPDERVGWADARLPAPHPAVARLDAVLRKDCALTVDIFGVTYQSTATSKP